MAAVAYLKSPWAPTGWGDVPSSPRKRQQKRSAALVPWGGKKPAVTASAAGTATQTRPAPARSASAERELLDDVDRILDKISANGLSSAHGGRAQAAGRGEPAVPDELSGPGASWGRAGEGETAGYGGQGTGDSQQRRVFPGSMDRLSQPGMTKRGPLPLMRGRTFVRAGGTVRADERLKPPLGQR